MLVNFPLFILSPLKKKDINSYKPKLEKDSMIAMVVMMEKSLLKMFIFGLRLVLDYNEACTNKEDCQDWIVKIKVKGCFLLKVFL